MELSILLPELLVITGLACLCSMSLIFVQEKINPDDDKILLAINRLLPQTQCAQCGYSGCRPYADAIIKGEAINLCPPGGSKTVAQLAEMLGRPHEVQNNEEPTALLAKVNESDCIGCTLCISACPVDAIIGAQLKMHTVLAEVCTGCKLCIDPCPVDCIELISLPQKDLPQFPEKQMACINCGFCEAACPRDLKPQLLYKSRKSRQIPESLHLDQCIECKQCDQVCPSKISLSQSFKIAKEKQADENSKIAAARKHEQRFVARQARILRNQATIVSRPDQKDRSSILKVISVEK